MGCIKRQVQDNTIFFFSGLQFPTQSDKRESAIHIFWPKKEFYFVKCLKGIKK